MGGENMSLTSEKLHKQTLKEQRIVFGLSSSDFVPSRVERQFNYQFIIAEVAPLLQSGGHRVPVYVRALGL